MIGMIVTGHGKFAPGALDALKLLVGEQEYCEAVEFEPSDSVEQLTEKIDAVWQRRRKSATAWSSLPTSPAAPRSMFPSA